MIDIHVTTARPLAQAMHDTVEQWLTDRYGAHTTHYHVDDAIVGGIIIFDGSTVYDGSLRSKLQQLHHTV